MKNTPLVSVITPAYNCEATIAETITSVLAQTFSDFELIIVDDGSTDSTAAIVHSFTDERIRYIHQINSERSIARNNGIENSNGKYIAFLDADDLWLPEKLQKQLPMLEKRPELGLVYSGLYYFDDQTGERLDYFQKFLNFQRGDISLALALGNDFIQSPTPIVPKHVFERVGTFDPDLPPVEDWDMWIRIAYHYPVDYIDEPLACYRVHANMTTWKNPTPSLYRSHLLLLDKTETLLSKTYPNLEKAFRLRRARVHYNNCVAMFRDRQLEDGYSSLVKSLQLNPLSIKSYLRCLQFGYLSIREKII